MANKKILAGALALLGLALMFAGCDNVQQVKIVYDKAATPGNVEAEKETYMGSSSVTLSFNPVENATAYAYYIREKGGKVVRTLAPTSTPAISSTRCSVEFTTLPNLTAGTTYEFGVQVQTTFAAAALEPSDVAWAELTW
jgi:hypothetical protein